MKTISVVSLGLASLLGIAATALAAEPAPKAAEAPKADAAKAEAPKAPSAEAVAAGKKIDWATMDEKAKKKYMKTTVLPTMKKLFVAFDKKHYAAMNCATCHGKKAVESNKLKMPSAELPKLPGPTDCAGFMALQEKKPDVVKFMGTQVKPTMAALLGKTEWSPTNARRLRLLRLPHQGRDRRGATAGSAARRQAWRSSASRRRASRAAAPGAPPGKGW